MRPRSLAVAAVVAPLGMLVPGAALAHGGGGAVPKELPPSPPGDGATAQGILRDLEAKAAKDPDAARVTAEAVKSAKLALERARGARASGDEVHARMLDGVALEWAETARELERAALAERAAEAESKRAYEAQTKAERGRALLEETQARRGRTAAELARVEGEAKDAAKGAADTEDQRLDAAKRKKGAAAPPPAKTAPGAPPGKPAPKQGAK
jgi:hypothetical protein